MSSDRSMFFGIDDVDLTPIVLSSKLTQSLNKPSALHVELRTDAPLLERVDLTGVARFGFVAKGRPELMFTGLVVTGSRRSHAYVIDCVDRSRELKEVPAGMMFFNMNPVEMIYYLLHTSNPSMVGGSGINGLSGRPITEEPEFSDLRQYSAIAPVVSCRGAGSAKVGAVTIGPLESLGPGERELLTRCLSRRPALVVTRENSFARIEVAARGMHVAMDHASRQFRELADVISFVASSSRALVSDKLVHYNRDSTLVPILDPQWILVSDMTQAGRAWFQQQDLVLDRPPLSLDATDEGAIVLDGYVPILQRDSKNDDSVVRSINSCLHALRMCRVARDAGDSLTALWNAIEFLAAADSSHSKQFNESQLEVIIGAAIEAVQSLPNRTDKQRQMDLNRVSSCLSRLNDQALRTKWSLLCDKTGVFVSEFENHMIWKELRKQRNDMSHGRPCELRRESILRAANVVSRALTALCFTLERDGRQDAAETE